MRWSGAWALSAGGQGEIGPRGRPMGAPSRPRTLVALLGVSVLAALACGPVEESDAVAYTNATIWDGTGAPPVPNATLLVREGRIAAVGAEVAVPRGAAVVDLAGRVVTPGLIDTHAHVTGAWAPEGVTGEMERIRGDLDLYATYGVTTVNSLGDGPAVIAVRDSATPLDPRARLLAAGEVVTGSDPASAREAAIRNADLGVDWLKLRVDDNLGSTAKMPWEAVAAVLDVGRERGIPVATHLFYMEDARRLLEMGTGMIAHSVRDVAVDAAFVEALSASGVCYVPTLVREVSTFVYRTRPEFFDDPFFTEHASASEVERASDPAFMERMAASSSAAAYEVALGQAQENLKVLSDAGIPIAFGTDAGPASRFPGYFEHLELELMVEAGLTPEQAFASATRVAAECLGMDEVGTLEPGRWADFLVFGANPLEDIGASKSLERVFIAGQQVR